MINHLERCPVDTQCICDSVFEERRNKNKADFMSPKKRAVTPELKKDITDRILAAWLKRPELRLGQLLQNSLEVDTFYIEDYEIIRQIESFVKKYSAEVCEEFRKTRVKPKGL